MGMDYDTWKTTPPEIFIKPVTSCIQCKAELFENEEAHQDQNENIFCSSDCFVEYSLEQGHVQAITVYHKEDE